VEPRQTAATLSVFALIGALGQLVATVVLGMARLDALTIAAQEGPTFYMLAAVALALGLAVMWTLRARPIIAAVAFIVWQVAILWPLSRKMSVLGLALYGEFILHHFVAVLAMLASLTIAWALVSDRAARRKGVPIAALVVGATIFGAIGHVTASAANGRASPWAHGAGAVLSILAVALWLGLELRRAPRSPARWAAFALALPLLLRVGSVSPLGLSQVPVPPGLRGIFIALLVAVPFALAILLRPKPVRGATIVLTAIAGLSTATLYLVYRSKFGDVEDGLGPLAQSLIGFTPPYPEYLSPLTIVVVMLGAFMALHVAGASMTAEDARDRGIGLALVLVAGVGWASPQLVLMSTAGMLLFLSDLGELPPPPRPLRRPIGELVRELGERLGLEPSEVAAKRGTTLHALRGAVADTSIDLRARTDGKRTRIGIRVGVVSRGRADVTLEPGLGSIALGHPLTRTHRVVGNARRLELHGDALLDACLPFATLRLGLWPAGAELELGDDLSRVDAATIETLVRALAAAYGE
jgi:hypothetical protein